MSVFVSFALSLSLLLSTSNIDESAAAAMKFVETDVKTWGGDNEPQTHTG